MKLVFSKDERIKDLEEGTKITSTSGGGDFESFHDSYEPVHQKDYAGFIAIGQ